MSSSFYLFLGGVSLVLHSIWELLQAEALTTCAGKSCWIKLRNCSVGIVSDVIYTFALYFVIGWLLGNYNWLAQAGISHYLFAFAFSFAGAYATELTAQKLNWWHFNRKVPHFRDSWGDVAVTPVLQLPLLVAISYGLTQIIYF